MTLTAADFATYFKAVHGNPPFPWQQRLVEQLACKNRWPDVLDVPTGAGKTAALDAAVFHLALQAQSPERTAALRIVLVVDRRLVVDDAYRRADKIACFLRDPTRLEPPGRAVVEEMACRLQRLAGDGGDPLIAVRLRGGAPLEDDWTRTPTAPTILCSTVDQVGSRLLFRGYGVTDRMKPVHAGLLGEDSLILLDEAHLSQPFQTTLQAVRELGGATVGAVVLSATPGSDYDRPFRLEPEDHEHRALRPRLYAPKPARLKAIGKQDPAVAFTRAARDLAASLRRGDVDAPAVGVVVNRIDLARDIFSRLQATEGAPFECALLIGRSRDVARRLVEDKLAPFRTGAEDRDRARALMVVATQCLEVGVDLDLDGLVTQAAPLDALRQRFGRLNRAGRDIPAAGAVLATSDSIAKKADDPVYGDRIRETWNALIGIATRGDQVDFGVTALDKRLRNAGIDVAALGAPRAAAPVVMPAYLDLWSHTSPAPAADPEVGLFLHGTERAPAEVSLVWRSDITRADMTDEGTGRFRRIMELVRPRSAEMLTVPIWAARGWLRRWNTARATAVADVPEREPEDLAVEQSRTDRRAFRWAGAGDPRTGLVGFDDLHPGDVLVVPADYGGCDDYGWMPQTRDAVDDVADEAAWPYRGRRLAVRVTPDVQHWQRLAAALPGHDEDLDLEALLAALPAQNGTRGNAEANDGLRDVRCGLEALRDTLGGVDRIEIQHPYGARDRGAVLVASRGIQSALTSGRPGAQPATEDDALSHTSSKPGTPVSLHDHTSSVIAHVDRFTTALRFDRRFGKRIGKQLAADLHLAATLHDIGKADPRFQLYLTGADWWSRPDREPLAKSGRRTLRGAWERAELPDGWRHEARSVRMAMQDPRFSDAHDPYLVLWLIGTHHGLGRPFFGFSDLQHGNSGPQSLGYDFGGLDWPSICDRLRQQYGIWRLAWLETILRLADHRASEAADEASA